MYPGQRISYLTQFGILLGLFGAATIFASLLGAGLAAAMLHTSFTELPVALMNTQNADVLRVVQGVGAGLGMGLPALVFARIVNRHPLQQLQFSRIISGKEVLLVLLLVYAALFVSGSLAELNEKIPLPKSLAAKFKQLEDAYNEQVVIIGTMRNRLDFLFTLLILALLPATVEEMFFRGCLQQVMTGWTKHVFTGILITSIIFSAIHFSYYGFLPRLFLGMLLGYIFYYGRNIWLNILAHFLNNALVVVQMYRLSRSGKLNADAISESFPVYWGVLGMLVVLVLFYFLKQESIRLHKLVPVNGNTPQEPEEEQHH
jgi:membrane protease YdiL (CAAX protease family)